MLTRSDTRVLEDGAAYLGLSLTERQLALFRRYHRLLAEWNRRVNLTAVVEWDAVLRTHFLDSLSVATAIPSDVLDGGCAVDVGSGAGFPGIPLKIAFPGLSMALVEATGKKVAFLAHVARELGLDGMEILHGRAEHLAHDPRLRASFDAVLVRALGPLAVIVELSLPFVRSGGLLIAQKKGDVQAETADAAHAIQALGGQMQETRAVNLPGLGDRALVLVRKIAETPERYPRRPGMPARRPMLRPRDRG